MLVSLAYIFVVRQDEPAAARQAAAVSRSGRARTTLSWSWAKSIIRSGPSRREIPHWLIIPERGLYTGIVIFGAIGSGKTSGCMYPFAEQILAYRADDPEKPDRRARAGSQRRLLPQGPAASSKSTGAATDYLEVSLDSDYRYNPLYNDLDAYALAYGIASLLNNLFGKGKEPFWQQAYTNLVKFVILLHKVLYDYVTLFDVYEGAINPDLLEQKIKEGEQRFAQPNIS